MRIRKVATAMLTVSLALGMAGCGNSGKPSKEEVKAGFEKTLNGIQAGIPEEIKKKMTGCVVDESYDKLSVDALKALQTGDRSKIEAVKSSDREAITSATRACATKMVAEIGKSVKQ